mmetsp:Transcript_3135/g.12585  ORF Transcript_3135/g.12585 Transcript_3135/m.12585 type:complete len:347 (+) Transcript_3135:1501-2541(+)|eukprot:scaffold1744_cov252-Pinguiococcus_pyrenoidosus.AAC.16
MCTAVRIPHCQHLVSGKRMGSAPCPREAPQTRLVPMPSQEAPVLGVPEAKQAIQSHRGQQSTPLVEFQGGRSITVPSQGHAVLLGWAPSHLAQEYVATLQIATAVPHKLVSEEGALVRQLLNRDKFRQRLRDQNPGDDVPEIELRIHVDMMLPAAPQGVEEGRCKVVQDDVVVFLDNSQVGEDPANAPLQAAQGASPAIRNCRRHQKVDCPPSKSDLGVLRESVQIRAHIPRLMLHLLDVRKEAADLRLLTCEHGDAPPLASVPRQKPAQAFLHTVLSENLADPRGHECVHKGQERLQAAGEAISETAGLAPGLVLQKMLLQVLNETIRWILSLAEFGKQPLHRFR